MIKNEANNPLNAQLLTILVMIMKILKYFKKEKILQKDVGKLVLLFDYCLKIAI